MQPRKMSIGMASIKSTSTAISLSTDEVMKTTGLQPCAASSTMFLYGQGNSVVCLKHDTLELERRMESHEREVLIVSIDNTTPEAPRVVSVDAGKTAIVWDLLSGEEVSRFTSYEDIRVATWMKNGNLTFGDSMGNVILFDPIRIENISARTIFDPLTSIAPSADCRSFALGYNNGSILVAALSPSFTILHTLTTTSLQPSSITTLAWHASSSKQKSDMLAVQTRDGDLRVWSVPKSIETEDTARVVRVLKREHGNQRGDNWLGWSRNGRIVQYSGGATTIWDVRTKKVAWEDVPAIQPFDVCGITVHGPTGTLFTLSTDHTVQQVSLQPQALVASVLHRPNLPPPSPPVSFEETEEHHILNNETLHSECEDNSQHEQDIMRIERRMTPLGRIAQELEKLEQMEQQQQQQQQQQQVDYALGITGQGEKPRSTSVSSVASVGSNKSRHKHNLSTSSKETTTSTANDSEYSAATTVSPTNGRKGSISLVPPQPSPRRLHPLRQEIHISPEVAQAQQHVPSPTAEVKEIFPSIKDRMVSVTYENSRNGGTHSGMDDDDRRKEMLFCLFGWKDDIEGLISDELESANARSLNAIILRLWLGDLDQNSLAVMLGADFTVSGDWLFIALSAMGGQNSWTHVARAFVMRLLQKNDLHMAVLCLLAIGDKTDAVELYVSHKQYLEAVLLTTLTWKKDWKKISGLVRKWGEYALETHDTGLAARCFACAGTEASPERPVPSRTPPSMGRTPSMVQRSASHLRSRSENETSNVNGFVRGLSISSPSNPRTTLKMTPKNSPLKLITDFPSPEPDREPVQRSATTSPQIGGVNRFFYPTAGGRSACGTPIAMSALTPVDPFWQHDPFPPTNRSHTPAQQKLAPVTEASPADAVPPIKRMPEQKGLKISSPIEPRTSTGFVDNLPVTSFGQVSQGHAPQRKPSPPTGRLRRPSLNEGGRRPSVNDTGRRPSANDVGRRPSMAHDNRRPSNAVLGHEIRRPNTDSHGYRKPSMPTGSDIPPPLSPPPTEALPSPPQSAFSIQRSQTPRLPPSGLKIQWPHASMDTILREASPAPTELPANTPNHSRKGSLNQSPPVQSQKFTPKARDIDTVDDFMDLMERSHKRIDTQRAVATPRPIRRAESPDGRRANRPKELNLARGRKAEIKGSLVRSPSSPLPFSPQARIYAEELPQPPPIEDEPEPLSGRFYGDEVIEERGREAARDPPVRQMVEQARHYQYRDNDRIEDADEYDDERYYTTVRHAEHRGRQREGGGSHARSPSSPLPMAPQAQFYREMAVETDHIDARPAPRNVRRPSVPRLRERPAISRVVGGLRRSRSERTLKQWSQQLEREGRNNMTLERTMTTRGLPSNPRIWRSELQAASRAQSRSNSPMPNQGSRNNSRGRSPAGTAIAPAPVRSFTMDDTRAPRNRSPAARPFSPARRPDGHQERSSSMARHPQTLGEHISPPMPESAEPSPRHLPLPHSPPISDNSYYRSPNVAEYESVGSPLRTNLPELPSIPGMLTREPSHRRNNSLPAYAPLIRKLGRQEPPDSPPPLPFDLPVHPALQMHLEPTLPGRKNLNALPRSRTIRRMKRSEGLVSPVDDGMYNEGNELSIVVGIDAGEAARGNGGPSWNTPDYGRQGREPGSQASGSVVGMGNMI